MTAALARAEGDAPAPAGVLAAAERWALAEDASQALDSVLGLVARHPGAERLQLLAVRLLERLQGRGGAITAWRALHRRFPRNPDALLVTLRWTLRQHGPGPAASLLATCFPDPPASAPDMLLLARALEEIGEQILADAAFARLARRHPGHETGWLMRAQAEERRGRPWCAQQVVAAGLAAVGPRPRLTAAALRLEAEMAVLDRVVTPAMRVPGRDVGSLVLAGLVQRAAADRAAPMPAAGRIGPVVMVGGSLGAGGAERQMVTSAISLQEAHRGARPIAGHLLGGVQVVCRALNERPGGGFFAPQLMRHRVPLRCYASLPPFGGQPEDSAARDAAALIRFLSPRVAEATVRLTDALRGMAPAVVHLWQDGTILACVLAALLARVPRIVLSVRTAPPQDRPERDRPEYALLYPLLARMPGVTWTANSRFAAQRYGACIGMDPARIRVVPNGIALQPAKASAATRAMLAGFESRTGAGFTVGAVMRFDDNKRPLEVIECAARLLTQRPDARFILVGDGPLRAEAEACAAALGGRVLFTGRSTDVGFWLARMDALVLLSRCEGLPNALLEAQLAGVPVVATPAGGAPETLRHGSTGYLLGDAAVLRPEEVVARLQDIAASGGRTGPMSRAARRFVSENFSVGRMLEGTVESYVQ
ncbi:glycosyltransferase [Falsiroseomonas sp. E2-1-a20]|uniref:glycosyltransferase n=1 Tax=Falsiroseomonas sp. E2-1-a20 TaxID=3239300 RepID=UPI003F3C8DCE